MAGGSDDEMCVKVQSSVIRLNEVSVCRVGLSCVPLSVDLWLLVLKRTIVHAELRQQLPGRGDRHEGEGHRRPLHLADWPP